MKPRAQQLTVGKILTEDFKSVKLKFCVDPEILAFDLALRFIEGFDEFDRLTDEALMT